MKFLADMGISPRTVSYLRDRGHDAVHLRDRGQEQLEDPSVLRLARTEGSTLLVHDLDFSDLVAASGTALPSVIVFRLRNMEPSSVNERLEQVIDRHPDRLEEGAIFTVTEARIRWRPLPFDLGT